ncbi:MAG: hypothetical protein HQK89_17305 [Nitrospirae bacterium]|nr:hypothetical protein [Nitrospirota bacterium]
MRALVVALALILVVLLPSCAGNKDNELFDTAKFEELQKNPDHARQLYEEIIVKYPNSKYAGMARERLRELEPKETKNKETQTGVEKDKR